MFFPLTGFWKVCLATVAVVVVDELEEPPPPPELLLLELDSGVVVALLPCVVLQLPSLSQTVTL